MNKQTVQSEITRIVEAYRASDYNHGNKQYPASKKYLAQAEELGILEFIPNMPFKQQIGNTEIQLILKEAMQSGGTETFTTTEGEGDDVTVSASALFTAINEINRRNLLTKKLQQISETTGLQARYGGGDYTVTAWADDEGGYDLIFCKSNTDIAHARESLSADQLESEMRKYQPDLRRWRKVEYGE